MKRSEKNSRRNFLKLAAAGTVAAGSSVRIHGAPRTTFLEPEPESTRQVTPNDRIRIGLIGAGGMGFGDTETALQVKGVELVAAADLYDGRLARVKEAFGKNVVTTRDYREVLARQDIDAVIIATPDHWHSKISIDAMKAGKDVYCEKPVVQLLDEGRAVIDAQRETKRIFQVGSQFVSSILYQKAKEMLAAGKIGELNLVDSTLLRRSSMSAWQYSIPPDASPQTIDWDRFLGRAPKVPFDAKRFFRWRNYRDYGTGIGGDLFVHQFTSAHFVTGSKGPSRVFATGGLRLWNDGRDVPDILLGLFDYPKTDTHPGFNMNFRVSLADGGTDRTGWGTWQYRFVGSEGVIEIGDAGVSLRRTPPEKAPGTSIDTFSAAVQEAFMKEYRKQYPRTDPELSSNPVERFVAPARYDERLDHFKNFFKAMRSRVPVVEDAVFGFRAAAPALMANVSYFEGRVCEWDPEAMRLKKEEGAKGK
jgi:predicted dehydrogenase